MAKFVWGRFQGADLERMTIEYTDLNQNEIGPKRAEPINYGMVTYSVADTTRTDQMGASPTEVGGLRWARLALWSLALDETSPAQRIRAAPIAGVHALACGQGQG